MSLPKEAVKLNHKQNERGRKETGDNRWVRYSVSQFVFLSLHGVPPGSELCHDGLQVGPAEGLVQHALEARREAGSLGLLAHICKDHT